MDFPNERFFGTAAVLLAAGLGLWLGNSSDGPGTMKGTLSVGADGSSHSDPPSAAGGGSGRFSVEKGDSSALATATVSASDGEYPSTPSGPEMLEQWLSSSADPKQVGYALLRGFSQLPPESHAAAAKDLVNLVRDEDFDLLQRLLADSKTSVDAKEILYRDVLARPVRLRFPALLTIMRQPGHPHAEDAHDALARYLDGDWGKDYDQWHAQIDAYLRRMN